MNTAHPDIVVVSPDGEYLVIVEVKLNDNLPHRQGAIKQLKSLMASMGCSVGLAVTGERILLLRDSLEKSHGESIAVVGEATLPENLLPANDEQWTGHYELEFESRIQQWLETVKQASSLDNLPSDLRQVFSEPTISLLRLGEIRAAGPRWSKVAS
ncbi:MAG: hypothetical protein AAF282_06595 [Cyanobacteria bacterium P01_A01_bin.15]